MCGIVGFVLNRPLGDADIRNGLEATRQLQHRGPDDSGYWADPQAGVFLGHTRLSILDLSAASRQPMVRQGSVLAYNGELYNFRAVRQVLKAEGAELTTSGDTEVVLEAWRRWGAAALDRFDGMFAVALYHQSQLHLATDPFGEKPLYWAQTDEGIYFASEAGVLARLIEDDVHLSDEDRTAFLCLGFLPEQRTGYRRVRRLAPATHLVWQGSSLRSCRRYWGAPETHFSRSGPVLPLSEPELDTVHHALIASVRDRLHADVPVGLFLSAGVDSALAAAIAVKELGVMLPALTVAFPDGRDESARAADIAGHLNLPHTIIDSRNDPLKADPEAVTDLFGELDANLTILSAFQMARAATPKLKTVLTGIGGDELFYGYGRYQFLNRHEALFLLPSAARRFAAMLLQPFAQTSSLRTLQALGSAGDNCRILAVKNGIAWPWLAKLPHIAKLAQDWFPSDGTPLALAARRFDLMETMPASYIPAIERASMRTSLEVRTPYLSRPLLSVLSAIDQRRLLAFGQKSVLRRLLTRYLPGELVAHPKQGFSFPQARFLQGIVDAPAGTNGISRARLQRVWDRKEERNWQTLAVRLVMLDRWQRMASPQWLVEEHDLIRVARDN